MGKTKLTIFFAGSTTAKLSPQEQIAASNVIIKQQGEAIAKALNSWHKQNNLLDQYVRNIKHPIKYIQDQFNTILEEFIGVEQFVHPDREMVEKLQQKIRDLETKEKETRTEKENINGTETRDNSNSDVTTLVNVNDNT